MSERWYPTDGSARLERSMRDRDNRADLEMVGHLRRWLRDKGDPRVPHEAIILLTYEDGFSVQYLGPEPIDPAELVKRVVYVGEAMREASGG